MQQTLNEKDYSHLQMISVYEVTALLKSLCQRFNESAQTTLHFPNHIKSVAIKH